MKRGLNRTEREWLKRIGPAVLGLAAIAVLVVLFNPAAVGRALSRFQLAFIPAIVALYLWLSALDLGRALASVTVFWVVVQGLSPRTIGLTQAGFVLAISSIGGAISLIPGGVGANEASVAGLLLVFGVDGGAAAAAALIQRLLITGMAIGLGLGAYAIARRRFKLGGLFELIAHKPATQATA